MTVAAKTLAEAAQVPATDTTIYTTPANTRTIIDKMTAANTTGAAVTLTAYVVAASDTTGPKNTVMPAQSIAGGATYLCPEVVGHILNAGDYVAVKASASASIGVRMSGREAN